jgi:hypothetical protein
MIDRRRLMDIEWVLDNEEPSEADLRDFEREIEAYIAQPDDPGRWPAQPALASFLPA